VTRSHALVGSWLALVAAMTFGVTTPFVQRFGHGAGPAATAALLYAGAAAVAIVARSSHGREAPLRREHVPRLLLVASLGAFVAPIALAWGLQRTSGVAASLMLNLEAVFTAVLARLLYKEHVGRRVAIAIALLCAGGALLVRAGSSETSALGLAAIALATFGWAADNALAKPLARLDPSAVVMGKALLGAGMSVAIALARHDAWPVFSRALALFACGATGYGMSLRLYVLAQRRLGAARTGSIFATGPFFGAVMAWSVGEQAGGWLAALATAAMIGGVALHLTERHEHEHAHEPVEHEHAHRHDDGHHDHAHDPMPAGEHSHVHRHERIVHTHPHVPDLHHGHDHEDEHAHGHEQGHG
jgi:drug/metabolite transporter (DMT)-like permease